MSMTSSTMPRLERARALRAAQLAQRRGLDLADALLHQRQRQQAPGGEILATIEDYAVVEELFAPSFAAIAEDLCPPMIWDMVDAIGSSEKDISETQLAHRLRLTKQAISPRVRRALKEGWLVNDEPRRGLPYRLRRGGPMPGDVLPLPEADAVAYAVSGVPAAVRNVSTTLIQPGSEFKLGSLELRLVD